MKIVIAPDSYKGSLSAREVCDNIEIGIKEVFENVDIIKIPMADGGEGTVQALVDAINGKFVEVIVKDPLFRDIKACYGILDNNTAVIEMSAASGLPLIEPEKRDPLKTTTFGTGQMIKDALDKGIRNFIIGLGGSATNDGGIGMAAALGAKFLDKNKKSVDLNGSGLCDLCKIDLDNFDSRIKHCNINAACDVDNILCGENGASYVYGKQKGGNKKTIEMLDKGLANLAQILKLETNIDIMNIKGSGAAGGLGAGVIAFLNGKLKRGIEIVINTTKLEEKIIDADLVITGEGRIDYQTQFGKTPYGVAKICQKYNIPLIAICGSIGERSEELYKEGFTGIFSIIDNPMMLEECLEKTPLLIQRTTENILRLFK